MAKISSHIGKELYRTEIASPSGSTLLSDEPLDRGGQNKGLSPTELLAASLAACTSVTLRMYADRKGWDLAEINTHIELVRDDLVNKTAIERSIQLIGNLDETQKARLLAIANNCPVHRILNNPIEIKTELI